MYSDAHVSSSLSAKVAKKVLDLITPNARQFEYSKFPHWHTNTICLDSSRLGMAQSSKETLLILSAIAL